VSCPIEAERVLLKAFEHDVVAKSPFLDEPLQFVLLRPLAQQMHLDGGPAAPMDQFVDRLQQKRVSFFALEPTGADDVETIRCKLDMLPSCKAIKLAPNRWDC
jgi:hypothetical protein